MVNERLEKLRRFADDIIFPNRCPFCGKFIMWNEYLCEECGKNLTYANDVICHGCGQEKCRCGKNTDAFDSIYASFFFDEAKQAVYRMKNNGGVCFAELSAKEFAERASVNGVIKADMIVPVPMGRRKRRKRGFNQADVFGKSLGRALGIPVRRDILFKYDENDEQHLHSREERRERVKALFYGEEADLSGKNIIVCDDVMTTGSTLSYCSELLKNMGAESVIAVVCTVTRLEEKDA